MRILERLDHVYGELRAPSLALVAFGWTWASDLDGNAMPRSWYVCVRQRWVFLLGARMRFYRV